jgi:DNA-binding NtrC family response regulator
MHPPRSDSNNSTLTEAASEPIQLESKVSQRILVVDDDPEVGRLHAEFLIYSGYQVESVRGAEAAAKALRWNQYDLLIIDNALSKIGAIHLSKILMQNGMKILVTMSAKTTLDPVFADYLPQMAVLMKPYTFMILLRTVENFLFTLQENATRNVASPHWGREREGLGR